MEMSKRAKRMEKRHGRNKGGAKLNITSLMDVFTILLIFLLVNQSEMQAQGNITLPKSVAEKAAKETLVLSVSNDEIYVATRRVATVAEVMATEKNLIEGLQKELKYQSSKQSFGVGEKKEEKPITIMGDKDIPYKLLKKIMITCSVSGYSEVSLATQRTAGGGG